MKFNLYAPLTGEVFPITKSSDDVFSSKVAGNGFFVKPSEGEVRVVAPCDGKIAYVHKYKHAVMIKTEDAVVLIHVGIDSVNMKGSCFGVNVKESDTVKAGDTLLTVDFKKLEKLYKTDVIVTIAEPVNGTEVNIVSDLVKAKELVVEVEI